MSSTDIVMAAAGNAGGSAEYVEDVFSTWLYTGTGSSAQTITNGIDLAGKGGLVWFKDRDGAFPHMLLDTDRVSGSNDLVLSSDLTSAQGSSFNYINYNNNGFTITSGASGQRGGINDPNNRHVSWTFRKAPKFFDVVTYTGNGVAGRQIAHSLGSVPGMIIIKRTNAASNWTVIHRGMANTGRHLKLNLTDGEDVGSTMNWDATTFTVGTSGPDINLSGGTYVAYLFAHNAGGFGDAGTDNIISCGSYIGNGSTNGPTINLGYEPQWILTKNITSSPSNWFIYDSMRGMVVGGNENVLQPHRSNAEFSFDLLEPTATGFRITSDDPGVNSNSSNYIYMAIRRPMKKPTSGTQVFSPQVSNAAAGTYVNTGFPLDAQLGIRRTNGAFNYFVDRLRGVDNQISESGIVPYLATPYTSQEFTGAYAWNWDNTGYKLTSSYNPQSMVYWNFRRAPGFFDVVCYTGTGVDRTVTHNLGVAPELIIVKRRDSTSAWSVYSAGTGNGQVLNINSTSAAFSSSIWANTSPTASVFTVGSGSGVNGSGSTYVAYLFASCPGVSKVGTYIGTGAGNNNIINCGFTNGARFVMIKLVDSTSDWWVFDTARGITSGNDPFLRLNSTAAENSSTNVLTPASSGFNANDLGDLGINISGFRYLYLAIA